MPVMTVTSIRDVDTTFLLCRRSGGFGHQFEPFTPVGRRAAWGYRIELRCVRCTTERHDVYDVNGNLAARYYKYPKGYKIDFPITTEDVRLELVRRLRTAADVRVANAAASRSRKRRAA